jgi:uncharacterized membrane protein
MHLVNVVLFLHIAVVLIAIGVSSALHSAEWAARRSTTTTEVQALRRIPRRLEPLFPMVIVTLFALGVWLLHLDHPAYRYRDGWVLSSIVALVVLLAVGGGVLAPRAKHLDALLASAPAGDLPSPVRLALHDRVSWAASHASTGLALAVVFNMSTKPGTATSAIALLAGVIAGASIGTMGSRTAS